MCLLRNAQLHCLLVRLHYLKKCRKSRQFPTYASSVLRTTASSSHPLVRVPSSQSRTSSNSLPFQVVWGTQRSCSTQVMLKAISAHLPNTAQSSLVVKHQRASKLIWWFTIKAPAELIQKIEGVWHVLEAGLHGLFGLPCQTAGFQARGSSQFQCLMLLSSLLHCVWRILPLPVTLSRLTEYLLLPGLTMALQILSWSSPVNLSLSLFAASSACCLLLTTGCYYSYVPLNQSSGIDLFV